MRDTHGVPRTKGRVDCEEYYTAVKDKRRRRKVQGPENPPHVAVDVDRLTWTERPLLCRHVVSALEEEIERLMRVGGFLPPDIPPHVAVDVDSACTRCLV